MKRFLRYLIFIISLLFSVHGTDAYAGITERTIINELDLSELNQTQRTIFKKELEAYTTSLDALAKSDTAQWKKAVKEMLCKIRDGFRIYKLARDKEVEDKITEFDSTAHARVYVLTWVEDAFLNNIFLRLAQAYYETTRPDSYVILKYKYIKSPSYTFDKPLLKPDKPEFELSKNISDKLNKKISELTTVCYNALNKDLGAGCTIDDKQCGLNFNTSITTALDWLKANAGMVSNSQYVQFLDPAGNSFAVLVRGFEFKIITAVKYGALIAFYANSQVYDSKYNEAGDFIGYYDDKGKPFEQINYDYPKTYFVEGYEEHNTTSKKASFKTLVNNTNPFKTDKFASKENPKQVNILESLYSDIEKGKHETDIIVDFNKDAVREEQGSIGKFSVTLITCSDKKSQPLASGPEELKKKYKDIKPVEGTSVSFLENGYLVKKNGKEIEVTKITEDEITALKKKIEDGDITEQSEILFKTVDGKAEIIALGYRNKNFGPSGAALARGFTWNSSVRTEIQTKQKEIFNTYLSKLDNKSLLDIDPAKSSSGKFYDNKGLEVKEEKIYTKLLKMTKLTGELLKEIKIPESVWNYDKRIDYDASLVNISPYFSGVGDAIIDDAKSIPQLVIMTTELVLDDEKLQSLFNKFSNLTWDKVGKGIVNGSVGLATSIYNDLKGDKASNWHSKGTMTYNAMTIFLPGKILGKADDAIKKGTDDALENVGKVTEKIDELSGPFGDGFRALRKRLDELADKMSDAERQLLRQDLEDNIDLANRVSKSANPSEWLDAWRQANKSLGTNSILRKDPDVLDKLSDLFASKPVKEALGGEEGIGEILNRYIGKCKTCGDKGHKYLKNVDEYLADVKLITEKFFDVKGFSSVVTAMKTANNPSLQDGLTHMFNKVRTFNKGQIAEFEGNIAKTLEDVDDVGKVCLQCAFDVRLTDGTLMEFKSYLLSTWRKFPTSEGTDLVKQFKQYFQSTTSLEKLQYVFNAEKISDINSIKKEFQKVFKNDKEGIFNIMNQSLRDELGLVGRNAQKEFDDLINNTNSSLYDFIKLL